jgi:hypothetical protein
MRTAVVLPAPFGPSRPQTVPDGTSKPTPSSAVVPPKRLTRPAASMAYVEVVMRSRCHTHRKITIMVKLCWL